MPALTFLSTLIRARSGIVVGANKGYLLESRLAPILRRESLPCLAALAKRLSIDACGALERDVVEAVATHETLFFRDTKPFEHLRTVGLPALLKRRGPAARLRIWSAAASTGQEAYSLAITLAEYGISDRRQAEIVGTDLSRIPLERARAATYTGYEVQRGISTQRLLQHFVPDGDSWQVNPAIQSLCSFRCWNLLDDPAPLGMFDVIFCRNVLFYFDRPTRMRVLSHLRQSLTPDGLIYLGATETASGLDNHMERDGPSYSVRPMRQADAQPIAPRAATGQRDSTRPFRTQTYQS